MSYTRDTKTIGILANLSETKIYIMLISDQTYSKENTYRDWSRMEYLRKRI